MNFEEILGHHLLDHPFWTLFSVGGTRFAFTKHLLMMWVVGSVLLVSFATIARGQSRAAVLARTALETVALYIRDRIVDPMLGHAGRPYLHYFLTLFFFVLFCNLAGLVPYGATATGNIAVTAGLAACTLGLIILGGIREQGFTAYLQHIVPSSLFDLHWLIALAVVPLIFFIEIMGLFVKCFALTIRLFANMIAGHIVALGFLSLIFIFGATNSVVGLAVAPFSVGLALFVYALDLLVSLLQAYIFTMLTAVFVGGALHPH